MPTTATDSPAPARRPPQGPTLEEAAERMEGLLELREASQGTQPDTDAEHQQRDETKPQVADDQPVEGEEAEAEAQETPPAQEAEAEAEAPEVEEQPKGAISEDQLVTVRVDGKPQQVTLKEALEGYSRTQDYSAKTASL